jgi:adenylate cyclase
VDPSGDGGGGLTATGLFCGSCGTELPPYSKFCSECGTPVARAAQSAEYKQVTVLFADVVHSMDIARLLGAERLREIMAELVRCASSVVQRYDGTVGSFTGDGIMAVFGAPPWPSRRKRRRLPSSCKARTASISSYGSG